MAEQHDITSPSAASLQENDQDVESNQSDTVLAIPFDDDDLQAGLLKSDKDVTEEDQDKPRELITAKELRRLCYLEVRFSTAHYGTFSPKQNEPSQQACRIVFDFSFQQLSSWRFETAEIEIEFEDAANVAPRGAELGEDEVVDTTYQPRILAWEPRNFRGPVSTRAGTVHSNAQINLSPPGGIVGMNLEVDKEKPFLLEEAFTMHGVLRDNPPSRVVWTLRENSLTKGGIRREVSTALIVSYTPGHSFAARVRVRAGLWMGFLRPVCGKKDEPIFFNPDKMRKRKEGKDSTEGIDLERYDSKVSDELKGKTVPGVQDDALDRESLKGLTRLLSMGGEFL